MYHNEMKSNNTEKKALKYGELLQILKFVNELYRRKMLEGEIFLLLLYYYYSEISIARHFG